MDEIWFFKRGEPVYSSFLHFPSEEAVNGYFAENPDKLGSYLRTETPFLFRREWRELSAQNKAEYIFYDYKCPQLIKDIFVPAWKERAEDYEDVQNRLWNAQEELEEARQGFDVGHQEDDGEIVPEAVPQHQHEWIEEVF